MPFQDNLWNKFPSRFPQPDMSMWGRFTDPQAQVRAQQMVDEARAGENLQREYERTTNFGRTGPNPIPPGPSSGGPVQTPSLPNPFGQNPLANPPSMGGQVREWNAQDMEHRRRLLDSPGRDLRPPFSIPRNPLRDAFGG